MTFLNLYQSRLRGTLILASFVAIFCPVIFGPVVADDKQPNVPKFSGPTDGALRTITIPTVDLSGDTERHAIVARGTSDAYHGHCDTVLLPDGKTMFTAWTVDHAQRIGPLARSDDAGRTWSAMLDVPANWHETANTPAIHRLVDSQGQARLVVFGDGLDWRRQGRPPYPMHQAISEDDGRTWTPMIPNGVQGEVPPKTILSFDEGRRLILWSDLPGYVVQSESRDGGQTWTPERRILQIPSRWGQPCVVRSPDARQLLMLLRENSRQHQSLYSVSNDNAQSWSEPRELPASLTGDRHVARYAPDGRLVVAMRDMAKSSLDYGHYVAWIGRYEDIVQEREGQYRIKLLKNANRTDADLPGKGNTDCGYSDLEVLPDGSIVATTYVKYRPGAEQNSVVSTRFKLHETDQKLAFSTSRRDNQPRSQLDPGKPVAEETVLWDPAVPVPTSGQLHDIDGIQFHVIKKHQPQLDKFDWLHGIALAWHQDRLIASYGHNLGKENTASEVANYSVSNDHGVTWSIPQLIDDGSEPNLAVSHGVFLSDGGRLRAFQGAFYGRMQNVHTRAYLWDDATGEWTKLGIVIEEGFWPMQEPQRMADGNWIMAGLQVVDGIRGPNNPAAVAISHGDDFLKWDVISINKPKGLGLWGESTVLVDGSNVVNISRYQRPVALSSTSRDFGRTWTTMQPGNLPMAASKPYAGVLATGQRYLIGNTTADNRNRRWPLTIAVTGSQQQQFSRTYRIRNAVHDGPGESHPSAALSYPYAVERDGRLYVAYSNNGGRGANRNSAELAIIPVNSLTSP